MNVAKAVFSGCSAIGCDVLPTLPPTRGAPPLPLPAHTRTGPPPSVPSSVLPSPLPHAVRQLQRLRHCIGEAWHGLGVPVPPAVILAPGEPAVPAAAVTATAAAAAPTAAGSAGTGKPRPCSLPALRSRREADGLLGSPPSSPPPPNSGGGGGGGGGRDRGAFLSVWAAAVDEEAVASSHRCARAACLFCRR